jgi:XTP/dITP diphosphohydrolase
MNIVLATRNVGKVEEMRAILADLPVNWQSLSKWPDMTDIAEIGTTYAENARIKASSAAKRLRRWALADDSGLEVDALGGRPGVLSARYAGIAENPIEKMLAELREVPEEKRTARFVCVACLFGPTGMEIHRHGVLEGRIALAPRGEEGFGFDPIFIPEGHSLRLAEIPMSEKNRISHRAKALNALRPHIEALLKSRSI